MTTQTLQRNTPFFQTLFIIFIALSMIMCSELASSLEDNSPLYTEWKDKRIDFSSANSTTTHTIRVTGNDSISFSQTTSGAGSENLLSDVLEASFTNYVISSQADLDQLYTDHGSQTGTKGDWFFNINDTETTVNISGTDVNGNYYQLIFTVKSDGTKQGKFLSVNQGAAIPEQASATQTAFSVTTTGWSTDDTVAGTTVNEGGGDVGDTDPLTSLDTPLYTAWKGYRLTFSNTAFFTYAHTIEITGNNSITFSQSNAGGGPTPNTIDGVLDSDFDDFPISNQAELDGLYVAHGNGAGTKGNWFFSMSDTEVTVNISGKNIFDNYHQLVFTIRSDGTAEGKHFFDGDDTNLPEQPHAGQTAFSVFDTPTITWSTIPTTITGSP